MYKQITKEEALDLIRQNGYKPIRAILTDAENPKGVYPTFLVAVSVEKDKAYPFQADITDCWFEKCYIEVPDDYRYMTKEECLIWTITEGYKNHFTRNKEGEWQSPYYFTYSNPKALEYCKIEVIDGKIVYGEPKEFKVKETKDEYRLL